MAETDMNTPSGRRVVRRPHFDAASPLRGWSAADELLLAHLGTADVGRTLIVNDEFGALAVGLADAQPYVWTDSALSRAAIEANLVANGFGVLADHVIAGDECPPGVFDTALIRIPKTSALLDYQLDVLAGHLTPRSKVIGAGMTRHIHRSTIVSFEQRIGPTTTSLAVRKARLVHAAPQVPSRTVVAPRREFITDEGLTIVELPGTFCTGHVDVGSTLLIDALAAEPRPETPVVVGDLGCGNGVLAATLAARWPTASFVLTDVSDLAIAAARATWSANRLDEERARFLAVDGFAGIAPGSLDLVVTNPPFHQGHSLDVAMTDRLLGGAAEALDADGVAFVVAPRHLNLHTRMRRWFADVEVRSQHPSHVVLVAGTPKSVTRAKGNQ